MQLQPEASKHWVCSDLRSAVLEAGDRAPTRDRRGTAIPLAHALTQKPVSAQLAVRGVRSPAWSHSRSGQNCGPSASPEKACCLTAPWRGSGAFLHDTDGSYSHAV